MNVSIFILECLILMIVFGCLVLGMLLINPLTFVSDYPPEIQKQYYESQKKEATKEKFTKWMMIKKVLALIIFLFVFAWMAHKTNVQGFFPTLGVVYGYIFLLAAFDTFFLDWVLFANIKRVRLPGTETMDREYHQKWFHVKVLFPMIPIFLLAGVFIAFLAETLW